MRWCGRGYSRGRDAGLKDSTSSIWEGELPAPEAPTVNPKGEVG